MPASRFPLLLLAGAAALAACAAPSSADTYKNALDDGRPIESTWTAVDQFTGVNAAGPEHVSFTTGDRWQVRAEGDPRTLGRLRFLVVKGQLTVGRRSGDNAGLPSARIFVTAPALDRALLAGSGTLTVDRLQGDSIDANVAGSGSMTVETATARSARITLAGTGDLAMRGRAEKSGVTLAGSGRLAGTDFDAGDAAVTIAGSGSLAFRSDKQVKATIVGSGTAEVTGRATCNQNRIGSGRLRCGT